MFGAGAHHAADDPVRSGVLVRRAQDGSGGSGTQGEGRELAVEVCPGRLGPLQPGQGGFLRGLGILTVDDHCVPDLAGVDHIRRQGYAVDESEARVGHVEVHGRRRQTESVVDLHRDGRFEAAARDGSIDQQAHLGRCDAGLGQGLRAGLGGRVVKRCPRGPPAPVRDAGDPLEQVRGELQTLQRLGQPVVEIRGTDDLRGFDAAD